MTARPTLFLPTPSFPTSPRRTHTPPTCSQQRPQGPHCPLVTVPILRQCLTCAQKSSRQRDATPYLQAARAALRVSHRGLAEQQFLLALAADSLQSSTYFLYALHAQRRDANLARELFRLGARVNPMDAKLLQAWGLFESKQGKMPRARRLLRRSVQLEPKHEPVLKWKNLFPQEG